MTVPPLRRALAAAALLLLAPAAAGAQEAPPPSPPPESEAAAPGSGPGQAPEAADLQAEALALARALIDAGRFEEAFGLLLPLARSGPAETEVLFLLGLVAIEASRRPGIAEADREALLDEAIAALRAILVVRPEHVRVRLELARAFYLKGQDGLARRHFEQVLAGDPPAAVEANVNSFLSEIRARRRWDLTVGMALAPDSNLGAASDERIIYIFNLPFRRDAEELTTSGIGLAVWGGGEYQHPLGDRLRLRAGIDASRREYPARDFDQFSLSGHAGPRWLVDARTEVSVLASARQMWAGPAPSHRDLGVRVEASRRLGPRTTAHGRASWHQRQYRTRGELDGPVLDVGLRGVWAVTPTVRAEASLGYGRGRPELERSRNASRQVGADVTVALPGGFTVGGGGGLRWTAYQGSWFPFVEDGSSRRDRTRTLRASVLHRSFTVFGFSPQLAVTNQVRTTNAQAHDFRRTSAELRFVRQF